MVLMGKGFSSWKAIWNKYKRNIGDIIKMYFANNEIRNPIFLKAILIWDGFQSEYA